MKSKLKHLYKLIGPLLLIFIFLKIDFSKLVEVFSLINIKQLLIVSLLFLIPALVKSIRWILILKPISKNIPSLSIFTYYFGGLFWGSITPGHIGELIKIKYLKEHTNYSEAIVLVLIDRLLDIITLLGLSVFGIYFLKLKFKFSSIDSVLFFGIFVLSAFIVYKFSVKKLKKHPIISKLIDNLSQIRRYVSKMSYKSLFIPLLISAVTWVIYCTPFHYLSSILGFNLNPIYLYSTILISTIIALLPITIGGVGTRDTFIIYVFTMFQVEKEKSLVFSLMFIYMYVINICASGLIYRVLNTFSNPSEKELNQ